MTDRDINIAIADACEWEWNECNCHWIRPDSAIPSIDVPDYCHDLNAMAEAEKTLDRETLDLYADALICLIHQVDSGYFSRINWGHAVELITSSARQRAEAFLRVKGLWKSDDTKP